MLFTLQMNRGKFASVVAGVMFAFSCAQAATSPADGAKADLASRLKLPVAEVKVITDKTITWRDGALGLPKPDEMVTMALVPGHLIVLELRNAQYLYTASDKAIRFGGPVELWKQSITTLTPIPNEPNLNGNVVQTSCVGTNSQMILSVVSSFEPQSDGSILATRRTSRSGFTLLYQAPGVVNKPQELANAFAYGAMALDPTTQRWAIVEKPALGGTWRVIVGKIGASAESLVVLPEPSIGNPTNLYWFDGNLVAANKEKFMSIDPSNKDAKWVATMHPIELEGEGGILLNKSESLMVISKTKEGKLSTHISLVWFTGDEKVVSSIPGLQMKSFKLTPGGWVFITGTEGDLNAAYFVNMRTGLIVKAAAKEKSEIKFLNATPSNVGELHLDWLPDKYHFAK